MFGIVGPVMDDPQDLNKLTTRPKSTREKAKGKEGDGQGQGQGQGKKAKKGDRGRGGEESGDEPSAPEAPASLWGWLGM